MSLPDVSLSRAEIASVRGRLQSYQARYAPFFGRRELRGHARAYLQGLLSDEPRKSSSAWSCACGGPTPMPCARSSCSCARRAGTTSPFWRRTGSWWRATLGEGFSLSHAFLDGVAGLGLGYLADVARRGREPGPDVWLLLRRNPATDELKCHLSNGPAEMAPERLVWQAGLRWPIEQCFRDGKQLFGLGDYEGRSWQGWHCHATLVMLAHFFVVRETLRLKKSTPA